MKKLTYLLSTLSVASLLSFTACKEEKDVAQPVVILPACKPVKVINNVKDPNKFTSIEYNTQDKPVKLTAFAAGKSENFYTIEYDVNGRASRLSGFEGTTLSWYTQLEYNHKGQLLKATDYDEKGISRYNVSYEYDGIGNRIKEIDRETYNGATYTSTRLHEYANGNLMKTVKNAGMTDEEVTTFEYYMDKEDPLKYYMEGPLALILARSESAYLPCKNLLKRLVYTWKDNQEAETSSKDFTYEFNEKGYPTTMNVQLTDSWSKGGYTNMTDYQCQ